MLEYTIATRKTADKDGEFALSFVVENQDRNQRSTVGVGALKFNASNGWTVCSGKIVEICEKDKEVWILGSLGF